jgi:hypothetical protein
MQQHPSLSIPQPREQTLFEQGFTQGSIAYRQAFQGKPLSPRAIYDFLMNALVDVRHVSAWNAGYITGWFSAMQQAATTSFFPVPPGHAISCYLVTVAAYQEEGRTA